MKQKINFIINLIFNGIILMGTLIIIYALCILILDFIKL